MRPILIIAAASVVALLTVTGQAQAQANRTFVSGHGEDSNPCSVAAPCRSFAQAITQTNPGGEIVVLDSAGYGTLTIGKSITITNPGGVEAGITAAAGQNAITINAGASDVVNLRGLTIEGAGLDSNGIVFNSGGGLIVTNCVVQNFFMNGNNGGTGNGISIQPTSGNINFTISNTTVANNPFNGIVYAPPSGSPNANGVIDHVVATANGNGIEVVTARNSGGMTVVAISNTVASNNRFGGLVIDNEAAAQPFLAVSIDNVSATGNGTGIFAAGTPSVLLGRSVVALNNVGVDNGTPFFFTYNDNRINANPSGTDISSPLIPRQLQ